jgi:hypothetical protein
MHKGKGWENIAQSHNSPQSRSYSTNSLPTPPYTFPLSSINDNKHLSGLSGVYMIIHNTIPSSFYIGSSVNLFRRIGEYYDLTNNARQPNTSFERTLKQCRLDSNDLMLYRKTRRRTTSHL